MVSIDQFKQAFAEKRSPPPLQECDKVVSQALKRLSSIIDNSGGANGSIDGFKAALKKLVERYDTARKEVARSGTDATKEFDKILNQTGHVMASWLKAPKGGSAGGSMAAPPLPDGGKGPLAMPLPPDGGKGPKDQPVPTPADATGGAADHTSKTLKKGAKGPAVSFLQEKLNDEGADLDADGDFGPLTQKAVARFQNRTGVNEKGFVGPLTWQALNSAGDDGIDIDAAVSLAQKLHSEFEQTKDPALKGQLGRKLLAIAASLERRLGRAVKDGNGRPKLAGKTQWGAASSGVIADLAPFAAREQWAAASAASPPTKNKSGPKQTAPRPKSLAEEMKNWELKDGLAPTIVEVLDSKTGRPIPGATVSFNGTAYQTDEDGRVQADLVAPSTWKIEVSTPGYRSTEDTIDTKDKEAVLRKTRLVRKESLSGVPMEITIVNEIDGSKVKQAKVTVGGVPQVSDGDGFVSLVLPPGIPEFTVTAKGYHKQTGRLTVPELDLSQPQVKHEIKIKPQTALADELQDWELKDGTAPLIVEVLNSKSGKPVLGARVRVDNGDTHQAKSDGRIRVNVEAPGSRKIEVSMPGYQTVEDSFKVEEKRGLFRTVRLVPKDPATLDKVVMNVTVVDKISGKKVPSARIKLGGVSGLTDRDGAGANIYILPGNYPFTVTVDGYHKEKGQIEVPESKDQVLREIKIRPQTALADELQNWTLEDGKAPVLVEVLDAKSGKPIQGATVRFVGGGASFVTAANGRLRLNVKAPDSTKLEVSAPGYQNGQDSFAVEEKRGQLRTVRLAPISADKVEKVLVELVVADGTTGADLANAKVTVGRESGVTNEKGAFKVRVLPGIHSFSVDAKGYVKETGQLDVIERKDTQEQFIQLRPIGKADYFVRVLRKGSRSPIEKATVRLSYQVEYSNRNGEARFLNMPFGVYNLFVAAAGFQSHRINVPHNSQSPKSEFTEIELEPEKSP